MMHHSNSLYSLDTDTRFMCRYSRRGTCHMTTATVIVGTIEMLLAIVFGGYILYLVITPAEHLPKTIIGISILHRYERHPNEEETKVGEEEIVISVALIAACVVQAVCVFALFIGIKNHKCTLLFPFMVMLIFELIIWLMGLIVTLLDYVDWRISRSLETIAGLTYFLIKIYFLWITGRCCQYYHLKEHSCVQEKTPEQELMKSTPTSGTFDTQKYNNLITASYNQLKTSFSY